MGVYAWLVTTRIITTCHPFTEPYLIKRYFVVSLYKLTVSELKMAKVEFKTSFWK